MKKILFIILSMFMLVGNVKAETYVNSYYSVTNKSAVVKDNKVIIPVTVKANIGMKISNLIGDHRIDYIDNLDSLDINISNVSNDKLNVLVDYKKNSEDKSFIIFTTLEDFVLKRHDILTSFDLEVEILNGALIKKIDVLGNEVVFGDEETCENINGFKVTEIERIKYVDLSQVDHKEYFEDLFTRVIITVLGVALIICIILLIRKKK